MTIMKNSHKHIFGIIILLMSGCAKDTLILNAGEITNPRIHLQPEYTSLPDSKTYEPSAISKINSNSYVYDSLINLFVKKYDVSGISATLISPTEGTWTKNAGKFVNDIYDHAGSPVFYWASVSKLITSVIIHQLILENKLRLTDSLSIWYPEIDNSDKITIKMLLNHTSGIYNFGSDSLFHFNNRYYSPNELLGVVKRHKSDFMPGKSWNYTNTGYLLLALIAEKIEKMEYSDIVLNRIANPFELKTMKALNPNELPIDLIKSVQSDSTIQNSYSTPLGAGNIVGSSKDLAVFMLNLMSEKYIPKQVIYGMLEDLYGMYDVGMYYGDGIMLYDFVEINNSQNIWIGHSGGTENYKSVLIVDLNSKIICAVSISQDISAEAVARMFINAKN